MAEVAAGLTEEASAGRRQQDHDSVEKGRAESISPKTASPPPGEEPLPATQSSQYFASSVLHSVLDAQLEALALGGQNSIALKLLNPRGNLEEPYDSLLELNTEDLLMFHPRKGNSLPGTGSSIASSDHEVSSSDFESDSGIETSHTEVPSPDVGMALTKPLRKGTGPCIDIMPHDDLAITASTSTSRVMNQSNSAEKSCDIRIDSYIQCLDEKASVWLFWGATSDGSSFPPILDIQYWTSGGCPG